MQRDLHGIIGSNMGLKPSTILRDKAWRFNVV